MGQMILSVMPIPREILKKNRVHYVHWCCDIRNHQRNRVITRRYTSGRGTKIQGSFNAVENMLCLVVRETFTIDGVVPLTVLSVLLSPHPRMKDSSWIMDFLANVSPVPRVPRGFLSSWGERGGIKLTKQSSSLLRPDQTTTALPLSILYTKVLCKIWLEITQFEHLSASLFLCSRLVLEILWLQG